MTWTSELSQSLSVNRARRAARKIGARLAPPPREVPIAPAGDIAPPPMAVFHDITVLPHDRRDLGRARNGAVIRSTRSGPLWPDFDARTWERHNLNGVPFDDAPEPSVGPIQRIETPSVWLGYMAPHFGHLVAEHVTRVLWSRALRPRDQCLVTAPTTRWSQPTLPRYAWEVLAWLGLPRRQVRIIDRPVLARELRVVPQAEVHVEPGPDPAYLDLLDRHVAGSGLAPVQSGALYVTRLGMLAKRTGSNAGEAYLVERLRAAGVAILDPARAPLREQLARYAGARTLIFAEGSAIHGRQLLGRLDQRIVVLNRRVGPRTVGTAALSPRCADLAYVAATRVECAPMRADGSEHVPRAIAFYDTDALLAGLAGIGIDLARGWNSGAYRTACEADVATWIGQLRGDPTIDLAASLDRLDAVPAGPTADASGPWHRTQG